MHKRTTPKIFKRATPALVRLKPHGAREELRRDMTPQERKLNAHLRAQQMDGVHFRPQHAIGNFIADFCSRRNKLIIELDGRRFLLYTTRQVKVDSSRFLRLCVRYNRTITE